MVLEISGAKSKDMEIAAKAKAALGKLNEYMDEIIELKDVQGKTPEKRLKRPDLSYRMIEGIIGGLYSSPQL